jgi:beta-glucosidase
MDARDLSMVNEAGDRMVSPGDYKLTVGDGQPGTTAAVAERMFSVDGELKLPE